MYVLGGVLWAALISVPLTILVSCFLAIRKCRKRGKGIHMIFILSKKTLYLAQSHVLEVFRMGQNNSLKIKSEYFTYFLGLLLSQ